jgi:ATP-dependent RNA helicase DBP3
MREGGGCAVVVATPGRLRDFMNDGDVKLDRVTTLVLDEADRMLDLGFEPEIREIAGATRADRQTVMFSATWPMSIQGAFWLSH